MARENEDLFLAELAENRKELPCTLFNIGNNQLMKMSGFVSATAQQVGKINLGMQPVDVEHTHADTNRPKLPLTKNHKWVSKTA